MTPGVPTFRGTGLHGRLGSLGLEPLWGEGRPPVTVGVQGCNGRRQAAVTLGVEPVPWTSASVLCEAGECCCARSDASGRLRGRWDSGDCHKWLAVRTVRFFHKFCRRD